MEEKNEPHEETKSSDSLHTSYSEAKDGPSQQNTNRGRDVMMKKPWVSLGELNEPGPLEYVVEGLIPKGYITTLYGDGGNGKSYFALTIATCVAAGLPFCSCHTLKGPVFYVDFELDQDATTRRAYEVARGLGLKKPPADLYYLPKLEKGMATEEPMLTIIDSVGVALEGDSEKSRHAIDFMRTLKPYGSVYCVDHQSRIKSGEAYGGKDIFGSIYKKLLSRNVWQLQAKPLNKGELGLELTHKKSNFAALQETTLTYKATFGNDFILDATDLPVGMFGPKIPMKDKVIDIIAEIGDATAEQIALAGKLNVGTVKNICTNLLNQGLTKNIAEAGSAYVYRLVEIS